MKAYPKIKSFRSYIRSQPKDFYTIKFLYNEWPFKIKTIYWYLDNSENKVFV